MTDDEQTIAKLQSEIRDLKAQMIHSYHFGEKDIEKLGYDHLKGSSVVFSAHPLGGVESCPVAIVDGFSDETIKALKKDIVRSYKHKLDFIPSGVKININ